MLSVSNALVWVPRTTSVMRRLHVGTFYKIVFNLSKEAVVLGVCTNSNLESAREEKARGSAGSQLSDDKISLGMCSDINLGSAEYE